MYSFTLTAPLTSWNLSLAAHFHGLKTAPELPHGYISLTVRAETAVNRDLSKSARARERERATGYLFMLWHITATGNVQHLPKVLRDRHSFFSLQGGEIDLFMSCHSFSKLRGWQDSYWQFDTYKAKVNGKCGAINSLSLLACCFDTRSWRLIMRDE